MENEPSSAFPTLEERKIVQRQILRDFWTGLAFAIVLVLANLLFEHSPIGAQFEKWGDILFQRSLRATAMPDVVVLNIAAMDSSQNRFAAKYGENPRITSRARLRELIGAVASLSPRAIGVDVDMSPRYGGYADPNNDPAFFEWLLALRQAKHIPIYVGVYKATSLPTNSWLGVPQFKPLAASAALFEEGDNRTIPATLGTATDCGPSLSGALTGFAVNCDRRSPFLTLVEPETRWHLGKYSGQEYVVNYSALRDLQETAFDAPRGSAVENEGSKIAGKAVLIGDTAPGYRADVQDQCSVPINSGIPGVTGNTVPCVFVHAEGVFTLMQSPLYRLTPQARIFLDIVLAVVVLGAVSAVRWYYASRTRARVATERLYNIGFILFAIVILLAGGMLSRFTRVVWDDYILIVVVLLFHTRIERWLANAWRWLHANIPKVVFEERTR